MINLYDYIKTKFQERALRIDEFVSICEVSKSTVYRIMKGINISSDELQPKIINILSLNDIEQLEFKRLMSTGTAGYGKHIESGAVIEILELNLSLTQPTFN